ncbi:MAG: hypothetical protein ACK4UU_00810 [Fimbriimonadales bacterium]
MARTLGAGALFWAVFPLWLALFWGVQGYPPTLGDLRRWYALGAFNLAPLAAVVLVSPLALGWLAWLACRAPRGKWARRTAQLGAWLYALITPPVAYALLLLYAEMWRYRAWDVMTPTLFRAYLLLAPACGIVGALVGWTLKK